MKIRITASAASFIIGMASASAFAQNAGVPADVAPYLQGHVSDGDVRRAEESGQFLQLGSQPSATSGFILAPGSQEDLSPDADLAEDNDVTTGSISPRAGHRGTTSGSRAAREGMFLGE